jgi:hypothetical protein
MSLLPEEPLKNACVGGMSVADNIAFREFDRAPFASGGWWLNRAAFRDDADKKIAQYRIKTRTPDTPISALSGGNVQRTVLARELGGDVEVLIAANPCFGLDFAAVAQARRGPRLPAAPRRRGAAGKRGPRRAARTVGSAGGDVSRPIRLRSPRQRSRPYRNRTAHGGALIPACPSHLPSA